MTTTMERTAAGRHTYSDSRRARPAGLRDTGRDLEQPEERMAAALGWFSIGLGVTELMAPGPVSRFLGLSDNRAIIRAYGAREIASGIGILTQPRPVGWMWARLAGDMLDLASLGMAFRDSDHRGRVALSAAMVAGIAWLDYTTAQQMSTLPGTTRRDMAPDGSYVIRRAITINRSSEEIYRFWRNFENLPRIMKHLEEVRVTGDRTSHWVVKTAGIPIAWDAEMTDDQPGRRIAWRSVDGSMIHNEGEVRFDPAPQGPGTAVRVHLRYKAPGGRIARALAGALGKVPGELIENDLRPLKQLMETGEIATTEGQPSGRRSLGFRH